MGLGATMSMLVLKSRMGSVKVRVMNVTARLSAQSCSNPTDIAARTQTATIQTTVSAKKNLAAVANLASNISSQAGRLNFALLHSYLLYCTSFVLSSC